MKVRMRKGSGEKEGASAFVWEGGGQRERWWVLNGKNRENQAANETAFLED